MRIKKQKGQALFVVVGLLSVGAMLLLTNVLIGIISHDLALHRQQSSQARCLAEAGAEEAILNLLRSPNYSGGTLEIADNNVNIEVSGDNPKVINSSVNYFGKEKEVEVEVSLGNGENQIINWQEK